MVKLHDLLITESKLYFLIIFISKNKCLRLVRLVRWAPGAPRTQIAILDGGSRTLFVRVVTRRVRVQLVPPTKDIIHLGAIGD